MPNYTIVDRHGTVVVEHIHFINELKAIEFTKIAGKGYHIYEERMIYCQVYPEHTNTWQTIGEMQWSFQRDNS